MGTFNQVPGEGPSRGLLRAPWLWNLREPLFVWSSSHQVVLTKISILHCTITPNYTCTLGFYGLHFTEWAYISIGLPWLQSTIYNQFTFLHLTSSNQRNHHLVIFWFDFSWFHNQQQIDQILLPPWIILKILFQFYDHDHDLVFFPFVILQRVGDDMIRMQIKLDCGDTAGCETETFPCWLGSEMWW